jgi:hypothetical protein
MPTALLPKISTTSMTTTTTTTTTARAYTCHERQDGVAQSIGVHYTQDLGSKPHVSNHATHTTPHTTKLHCCSTSCAQHTAVTTQCKDVTAAAAAAA